MFAGDAALQRDANIFFVASALCATFSGSGRRLKYSATVTGTMPVDFGS